MILLFNRDCRKFRLKKEECLSTDEIFVFEKFNTSKYLTITPPPTHTQIYIMNIYNIFNEICINEEMLPKYIYIYIYIYNTENCIFILFNANQYMYIRCTLYMEFIQFCIYYVEFCSCPARLYNFN